MTTRMTFSWGTVRKRITWLRLVPVAVGLVLMALPFNSEANPITITNVSVSFSGGPTFAVWSSQLPVTLNDGQTLVLAQFNNLVAVTDPNRYNFDTSDFHQNVAGVITVTGTVSGMRSDTNQVLSLAGTDPGGDFFNEAQAYQQLGTPLGSGSQQLTVSVGYADNVHINPCGPTVNGNPGSANCFPSVFNGANGTTPASFFEGLPGPNTSGVSSGAPKCTTNNCWDSGVILLQNTSVPSGIPEPSTLVLLGSGLLGVAGWNWRRQSKKIA